MVRRSQTAIAISIVLVGEAILGLKTYYKLI